MPAYKSGNWDGKIRLFSVTSGQIYYGLLDHLTSFLNDNNITYEISPNVNEKCNYDVDTYIKSLKLPFALRDYQIDTVKECIYNNRKLILSPTSSGKCKAKDTPVLLYDGHIKMVQDIVIGDLIMGDDSTPRKVLSTCSEEETMYRITPKKGDSWVCNESHILSLVSNSDVVIVNGKKILKDQIVDVSILDYLATNKTSKHSLKQYRAKVDSFGDENNDVLDPWMFGVWLGDGSKKDCTTFHLNDSNKSEISYKLTEILTKLGYICKSCKNSRTHAVELIAINIHQKTLARVINENYYKENEFIKTSVIYIPHIFKTSSFDNRLRLIAGLLDSDGYTSTGVAEFSCKSEQLAEDICFLCRSVGLAAYKVARTTHANNKPFNSFKVNISGDLSIIPCIRLQLYKRQHKSNVLRTGITITKLPVDKYYGFELDGNRRYLLGDFTVTHNTVSLYMLANYYKDFAKVLIIFPNTSLVIQTKKEFVSYGMDVRLIHEIFEDREKQSDKPIVMSTWQGIYTQPKSYFKQYDAIICDECHTAVAKSLTTIMQHLDQCKYRFGFTGTLDGAKANKLQLMGLFGDCKQVVTTTELIKNKQISDVLIKIIILKHPYRMFESYNEELEYLVTHQIRNNFIKNLVSKLKGNTLVLFSRVEQQGLPLYEQFTKELTEKSIHLVYGKISSDERERIRQLVETEQNGVIIASYQTYQQGINIKNLHNIIFASPNKSRIRNLQSIGRGLRLHDSKQRATIYDIADNINVGNIKNYTIDHLMDRIKYYSEEELEFNITEIELIKKK
jgi:superfamily II DNA or RNA helicase